MVVELAIYMAATAYFNSHYNAWMWSFVAANTPSYDWETFIAEQADKAQAAPAEAEEEGDDFPDF